MVILGLVIFLSIDIINGYIFIIVLILLGIWFYNDIRGNVLDIILIFILDFYLSVI